MSPLEIILIILIVLFLGGMLAWQIVKRVRKKKGDVKRSCGCCDGCAAKGGCLSAKQAPKDDTMPEVRVKSEVICDFSDLIENK